LFIFNWNQIYLNPFPLNLNISQSLPIISKNSKIINKLQKKIAQIAKILQNTKYKNIALKKGV